VKLFEEPGAEPDWSACEVGEAHFSFDRVYRYALTRTWDERRPLGLIIGLNPSTADEHVRGERTAATWTATALSSRCSTSTSSAASARRRRVIRSTRSTCRRTRT
jgi:hypothetical protein